MELLPTIEPADLLLVDPPYGVGWQGRRRTATEKHAVLLGDDGTFNLAEMLMLMRKALRRGRHAYIFGVTELPEGAPFGGNSVLIWDKMLLGTGDLTSPWGQSYEPILFAVQEISAANRAKGYGAQAARLRKQSVLRFQRKHSAQTNRHPTEKPVPLLRVLIESSSTMGETVLDPCAGSGSTLVAAILAGRKAVGIELDPKFIPIAIERIQLAEKVADEMDLM